MLDIYRFDDSIISSDDGDEEGKVWSEVTHSVGSSVRTDTALQLQPLLNKEDLAMLSDNDLKDFLRNLPIPLNNNGSGVSTAETVTAANADKAEPQIKPVREARAVKAVNNATVTKELQEMEEGFLPGPIKVPTDWHEGKEDWMQELFKDLNKFYQITPAPEESENLLLRNDLSMSDNDSSDVMAASLLAAVAVARQRGWKVSGNAEVSNRIQGDLNRLRDKQKTQTFDVWER